MNPFDCNFQQRPSKDIPIVTDKWAPTPVIFTNTNYTSPEPKVLAFDSSPSTPPMSLSQSPSSSSSFFSLSPSEVSQPMQPIVTASTHDNDERTRRSSRIQTKQSLFSEYIDEVETEPKTASVQSGRKRRIVFEGDDAEDRRKKFLERNRVAGKV